MYNVSASKFINEKVAVYAGVPVTRLPKNGKLTLKWKATAKSLSAGTTSAENIKVAFKTKQFKNGTIDAEDSNDIVYKKDDAESATIYTSEFEIYDAKLDGTTVLYVKCTPTNTTLYVRFELVDIPIFVGE